MSAPLVEVRDVNFAYDKRAVLKGINMSFYKGKVIAIMGGSGCGKTTLFNALTGSKQGAGRRGACQRRDTPC